MKNRKRILYFRKKVLYSRQKLLWVLFECKCKCIMCVRVYACARMCVHVCACASVSDCVCVPVRIGWRRSVGCPFCIGHFLQKSAIISGSFAKTLLQKETCNLRHPVHLRHPVSDAGMPYGYRSFSTKEPYSHWLVCGKRPIT